MANAEQSLRNLLNTIAYEQNYEKHDIKLKPISSGGANYSSVLFLATISAQDKENIEVFAKVANVGQGVRDKINIDRLYKTEHFFYTDLLNKYKILEKEHEVPEMHRIFTAKFYGSNMKTLGETIVLENLTTNEFTVHDRFKTVDWNYSSKAIEEVAKLHALSIAYEKENPEEYRKYLKDLKSMYDDEENRKNIDALREVMAAAAFKATKEENRCRLKNHVLETISTRKYDKYRRILRRPVIIHGDYRPSNLMHKKDNDGNLQVIIIDYQSLTAGCPIMDLLYFIFNCSDEEFRGKYFDKLVEHYYTQLCLALRRLHVDPEKVYPREDFDYELKEMLPFGLWIGVFTLQLVTVEAAYAPKLDGGLSEFTEVQVKTSDLYSERLNGIVNDYIKWDIL